MNGDNYGTAGDYAATDARNALILIERLHKEVTELKARVKALEKGLNLRKEEHG
jgi:hypothetical protein